VRPEDDLVGAQGKLMAFLAAILQRKGVMGSGEFAALLDAYAETIAETDPGEGRLLARWAATVSQTTPN
jgi:hypothetical protein